MPCLNGNGPSGQGPMTGRACGYCILRSSKENPGQMDGFIGINGKRVVKGEFAITRLPVSESDIKPQQTKALLQEQLQIQEKLHFIEGYLHQMEERMSKLETGHRLVAVVLHEKCGGCGICADVCSEHAIEVNKQASVNPSICIGCSRCVSECPNDAIILVSVKRR